MNQHEYQIMYELEGDHWWFVGKQNLVRYFLQQFSSEIPAESKFLDVGCGTGMTLKVLGECSKAYGVELSPYAIAFLKENNHDKIVQGDVNTRLPFRNNSFSMITCLDVLEHIDQDTRLVKEMLRVCRPGGRILITVPAFQWLWSPHDVSLHHKRRYNRTQIKSIIDQSRGRVLAISYFNFTYFFPILFFRKIRSWYPGKLNAQSDLSIMLPTWMNQFLKWSYTFEIKCLSSIYFPFGVSLMVVFEKGGTGGIHR